MIYNDVYTNAISQLIQIKVATKYICILHYTTLDTFANMETNKVKSS